MPTLPTGAAPITVLEAKDYLRLGYSEQDELVVELVDAATRYAESYLGFFLVERDHMEYRECFGSRMEIKGYVEAIRTIQYFDTDGVLQTIDGSDYTLIPGRLGVVAPLEVWPQTADRPDAVQIIYRAGYYTCPADIRQAVRLLVSEWYDNRENAVRRYPTAAIRLLDNQKVRTI